MIQDALDQKAKENRRLAEIFRKGTITAVDDVSVPNIYTVSGRPMASVYAFLEVGDIVVYVDQPDPFIVGKFAGT